MRRSFRGPRPLGVVAAAGLLAATLAACGGDDDGEGGGAEQVKLGYFPNLTHASAIVGDEKGYFKKYLEEDDASLKTFQFNSGGDTLSAIASGDLDATYIGPSPALQAWVEQDKSVRLVSGAASGGASLVVSEDIDGPEDLVGKKIATPGLGNTQDVALKYWLKQNGIEVDSEGQGDLTVVNQDNSLSVQTFATGDIAGAWVPEPYATQLVGEGGKVLVDEASLWPNSEFVTTHLLVRKEFLDEHPDLVEDLIRGQVDANNFINESSDDAKALVKTWLEDTNETTIDQEVIDTAWENLTFTDDPIADAFIEGANHSVDVGLVKGGSDSGQLDLATLPDIYDLSILNKVLDDEGQDEIEEPSAA